jgi:chorismate dehydratase
LERRINIGLVSYLNTLPFIKGFEQDLTQRFQIKLGSPAVCADMFAKGEVDIALIPVGALNFIENYNLVTDFCIGCTGAVHTVCIFSHSDIKKCNTIYLHEDSRTSVLLAKILLKEYFKKEVAYINELPTDPTQLKDNEAMLVIGDKVFDLEEKFAHKIDLGEAWLKFTNLPFAFAVFVAKDGLEEGVSNELNTLLASGVSQLQNIIAPAAYTHVDLHKYYTENISYRFDKSKWQGMRLFMEKCRNLY